MDERIRQLRRVAISTNDSIAWQAYSRALERLCGIEEQVPLSTSGIDALLAQAGAKQKLDAELQHLTFQENMRLSEELTAKMDLHGASFFTFQTTRETEEKLQAIAQEQDAESQVKASRHFPNVDPKWYLFKADYSGLPLSLSEGLPRKYLRIVQLKSCPTAKDAFTIARDQTYLNISVTSKLATVLLRAVLGQ